MPNSHHTITNLLAHADKPSVGSTLIIAGLVPSWFSGLHPSDVYFAFLIPPAAWHCFVWFRKSIEPVIKRLIRKTGEK